MSGPGLYVHIVAGPDEHSSSVEVTGSVQHIITDEERSTFKLNDSQLKSAVDAYFGKRPNDAYLHSPTPWGDLYKTYNWPQVKTILVPSYSEILGITSEPVIVKSQVFRNSSSQKATFNVNISDSVTNTSTSTWSTGGTLTVGQTIKYEVGFLGTGGGGETSMSYSQSWGIGGEESKSVTVGSQSGVEVELDPGEAIIAELTASRGVMRVRIQYNAYLNGNTAVNYNPTYKGHHFWSLGISRVMSADGISNSVKSTEDIEIGYFSNSSIEIKDYNTNRLKRSLPIN